MRTVLLPHDGSALGVRAAEAIGWMLGAGRFRVVVLHLSTPGEPDWRCKAAVNDARRLLEVRGAEVELKELTGSVEAGVLEGVARVRPDLIAMGSHGRWGLVRWTRGSVAESVVHACPVPALVVSSRAPSPLLHDRPHRILVRVHPISWVAGDEVVEVRMLGVTKGAAVRAVMARRPIAHPIAVGDDATDEEMFAQVRDRGGCAIKVGPGTTSAGDRLGDVAQVAQFLEALADQVARSSS